MAVEILRLTAIEQATCNVTSSNNGQTGSRNDRYNNTLDVCNLFVLHNCIKSGELRE